MRSTNLVLASISALIFAGIAFAAPSTGAATVTPLLETAFGQMARTTTVKALSTACRPTVMYGHVVTKTCSATILTRLYIKPGTSADLTAIDALNGVVEPDPGMHPWIDAWVSQRALQTLAGLPWVARIGVRPANRTSDARPKSVGTAPVIINTNQNLGMLAWLGAPQLQQAGLTGQGIKVGVISNGATNYAADVQAGALPNNVDIIQAGTGDEGDWMLQVVNMIAPGATLGFCGVGSAGSVEACADKLVQQFGADIVVDDISFLSPVFFQALGQAPYGQPDSTLPNGASLQEVYPNVLFLSAAGNYEGGFFPNGNEYVGGYFAGAFVSHPITIGSQTFQFEDFGSAAGGASQSFITVTPQASQNLVMAGWNDPPAPNSTANNSTFEILLTDNSGNPLSTCQNGQQANASCDIQSNQADGGLMLVINTVQNTPYRIYLAQDAQGTATSANKLAFKVAVQPVGEGTAGELTDIFTNGSAANANAGIYPQTVSVASLNYSGQAPGAALTADYFSCSGPNNNEWELLKGRSQYTRLASPALLQKPDLATLDGWWVQNYSDTGLGPAGPFYGTSAAAPAAAALLAVGLQVGFTPAQLKTGALSYGNPAAPLWNTSTGLSAIVPSIPNWDPLVGLGRFSGGVFINSIPVTLTVPPPTSYTFASGGTQAASYTVTGAGPVAVTVSSNNATVFPVGSVQATCPAALPGQRTCALRMNAAAAGQAILTYTVTNIYGRKATGQSTVTVMTPASSSSEGGGGGAIELWSLFALLTGYAGRRKARALRRHRINGHTR